MALQPKNGEHASSWKFKVEQTAPEPLLSGNIDMTLDTP
jgi:hypothetical protein